VLNTTDNDTCTTDERSAQYYWNIHVDRANIYRDYSYHPIGAGYVSHRRKHSINARYDEA